MRTVIYLIVICVAACLGAYLALGYGEDDRGESRVRQHLEVIGSQLEGIKKQLQTYKTAHGHYPTNDEGLAALDNFDAKFAMTFYRRPDAPADELPRFFTRFWWKDSSRYIALYREDHGHVPTNAKEFSEACNFNDHQPDSSENMTAVPMEIAIGADDNIFLLSPAGVLSPWLTPYGYENRNGLDASKFTDSPANSDSRQRYSIRVDDGIFIYSVGGQLCAQKLPRMWWERMWPRFLGGIFLLFAILVAIVLVRSSKLGFGLGLASLLISGGVGAAASAASYTTCYRPAPLFYRRDAEMVAMQRELLNKYHSNGAIGNQAYQKAISALDTLPATQPTSAPKE
jgi:type II secretory pathway pseudopilin PulG